MAAHMLRRQYTVAALGLVLAGVVGLAAAQEGGGSNREREALRRTQAALRQAQEQQSALAREKSDLSAQRDQLDQAAKRAQAQLSSVRAQSARLNSDVARLSEELASEKARDKAARDAAQAQIGELNARLAEAQRLVAERTQANAALASLLTRATQSLAAAEKANREMYAFGLQLIDRVRGRSSAGAAGVVDPVLGLQSVQLDNDAERLRDQLEAHRVVNLKKTGAAPAQD